MKDKNDLMELADKICKKIKIVLKGKILTINEADAIIDALFCYFFANSLRQVPVDNQIIYIKERLERLGDKLSAVATITTKNNNTIH